jgi:hypothetical protein
MCDFCKVGQCKKKLQATAHQEHAKRQGEKTLLPKHISCKCPLLPIALLPSKSLSANERNENWALKGIKWFGTLAGDISLEGREKQLVPKASCLLPHLCEMLGTEKSLGVTYLME